MLNKALSNIATPSRFFRPRIDVYNRDLGGMPNDEPGEYQEAEQRTKPSALSMFMDKETDRQQIDLRKDFGEQGLQFLLEISAIPLSPDKPEYPGSEWHVQGQLVHILH